MPLIPLTLATQLEQRWLSGSGAPMPSSVTESADIFAEIVSQWLTGGIAGGFPCTTALARKPQLAVQAASALASPTPELAGARLGAAVALYLTGQSFGSGVAAAPLATTAAIVALGGVFADLDAETSERASLIALAIWGLALSTLVTFAAPPGAFPII